MKAVLAASFLVLAAPALAQRSETFSPPLPYVSLQFQGHQSQIEVGPGVPWLFSGLIMHPAAFNHPVKVDFDIAGEAALEVSLRTERRREVAVKFDRIHEPLEPLTLGVNDKLHLAWRLPAETTKKLPPGRYEAILTVRTSRGAAYGEPVGITVRESPARDDAYYRGRDALARGAHREALKETAAVLEQRPNDVQTLILRAEIFESQGEIRKAIKALDAAEKVILKHPSSNGRVPYDLLDYQARLRSKLQTKEAP